LRQKRGCVRLLNSKLPPGTVHAKRLQAVVLDWAGTTVDFGSVAPVRTLVELFRRYDIQLTDAEVRSDMGLAKKEHIRQIFTVSRVRDAWKSRRGHAPTEADVEEMYRLFVPLQLSCLPRYSAVIPGVPSSVQALRKRGLKIGSTTGYTRAMLDLLLEGSAKQGYTPDCSVSPEEVGPGRPEPFMLYENAVRLRVYPLAAIAKVGDTPADIEEGLNAGTWCVGVAGTGNGIGLTYDEFQALPASERHARLANARDELQRVGAHYVVDTLAELEPVVDDIDAHFSSG
jgi:phosphonoacetaldehyde hydrolase